MQTTPLEFAARAAAREASRVHLANMRGIGSLGIIARTASWIGMIGTIFGIIFSFGGVDGERATLMAILVEHLAEALVFTVLGIAGALIARWIHDYLRARSIEIDVEMKAAALGLINELALL
jgi:biopolymer transport protein ExbB/TolQ